MKLDLTILCKFSKQIASIGELALCYNNLQVFRTLVKPKSQGNITCWCDLLSAVTLKFWLLSLKFSGDLFMNNIEIVIGGMYFVLHNLAGLILL